MILISDNNNYNNMYCTCNGLAEFMYCTVSAPFPPSLGRICLYPVLSVCTGILYPDSVLLFRICEAVDLYMEESVNCGESVRNIVAVESVRRPADAAMMGAAVPWGLLAPSCDGRRTGFIPADVDCCFWFKEKLCWWFICSCFCCSGSLGCSEDTTGTGMLPAAKKKTFLRDCKRI